MDRGIISEDSSMYKQRFENLRRVARKITSSLNIGDILEMIRDEAKVTIPHAKEACLLMFDQEASHYTRPLHCAMYRDRINCQLCKRGRETIQKALDQPLTFQCSFLAEDMSPSGSDSADKAICEVALPINDGKRPLAVLDVIARQGHRFDDQDITLLEDLANLATNTIINARSHWKMSQERLTVDRILEQLRPFVPETVKRIVEKDPFAPPLEKQEVDVSILFLDVAGYTKISESLTQEKVNFIIEKYFSSFLDVIYAHQGDINETAGDGLMTIFQGIAKENALNAANAALEIRRRTIEINDELVGRFEPIEVNMGINSGIASVGMTRFQGTAGTRMTFTATGPVTNIAARIASAATNGDILVGPETAIRIEKLLLLHDHGLMNFKNVKESVRVFSLVHPH
jgi:class 3 adenylate cyclase